MSKRNCAVYVDGNGRYCVTDKVMRISSKPYAVNIANCGPVELKLYPTGDTDEVSVPSGIILNDGVNLVTAVGTFGFPDFSALNGTTAEFNIDEHKSICCVEAGDVDYLPLILECLKEGIELDPATLGELVSIMEETNQSLQTICDKLLAGADSSEEVNANLQALCNKLEALTDSSGESNALIVEELIKLCDKILAGNVANAAASAASLIALEQIKDLLTCPVVTATGVQSSWGN